MVVFTDKNFKSICDNLSTDDPDLESIIHQYGYPPLWKRAATFETLVHIILEQQVSLASALAGWHLAIECNPAQRLFKDFRRAGK